MRLFIGVFPPSAVQRDVHALVQSISNRPRARWEQAEKLHLTLVFLGEVAGSRGPELELALLSATAPLRPFDVEVSGLGGFPNLARPRVLFLDVRQGARALRVLWQRTVSSLPRDLRPREKRRFHPHLTLARLRDPPPGNSMGPLEEQLALVRWGFRVDSITLVESCLEPDGSHYRPCLRAPFGAH